MSQDVKRLLLFRHYMQCLFRTQGSKNRGEEWIHRESGEAACWPWAWSKETAHRINPTDGLKSVSLVFGVASLLEETGLFSNIPTIILKLDSESPHWPSCSQSIKLPGWSFGPKEILSAFILHIWSQISVLSCLCFLEFTFSVFTFHGMYWKHRELQILIK